MLPMAVSLGNAAQITEDSHWPSVGIGMRNSVSLVLSLL